MKISVSVGCYVMSKGSYLRLAGASSPPYSAPRNRSLCPLRREATSLRNVGSYLTVDTF